MTRNTPVPDTTPPSAELDQARWQGVLDTVQDAVISIDVAGRIILFNRSAEAIFGYEAEEVLGKNVALLMPAPYRDEHNEYIQQYQRTGEKKAIGRIREVHGRRRNGEVFPIELSVSEARARGETIYTAMIRDTSERHRYEEALRRERDFATRLIETAHAIVLVLDPEGKIVLFNPYMEELTGYSLEEARGRDWFSTFLPARDRDRIRELFRQARGDEPVRGNVNPIVTRDGEERWIEWSARTLRDDGKLVGVLSVGVDCTNRLRGERRTAAQYAVTRALAESTSVAGAAPRILEAICTAIGWAVGELWLPEGESRRLVLRGFWAVDSIDVDAFEIAGHRLILGPGEALPGRVLVSEGPVLVPDLNRDEGFNRKREAAEAGLQGAFGFPIRSGGTTHGALVLYSRREHGNVRLRTAEADVRDMLEALGRQIGDFLGRLSAEDARRSLAEIVEFSEDAITGHAMDGTIRTWNRGAEQLYGWTADEVIGKRMVDVTVPPEHVEEHLGILAQMRAGDRLEHFETVHVTKDGRRIDVSLSVSPMTDASGKVRGISAIARDVTAQREAERELEEARALAEQRERLAAIGAISAQIVHDLANPLAGVSAQAQLILHRIRREPDQPVESVRRAAEQIYGEVRRLEGTTREFLQFARGQRLDLRELHLAPFLQEIVDLWQPVAADRNVDVRVEIEDDLEPVRADPEQLRRVLHNLVKNAVEAMDRDSGNIRIRARRSKGEVRISVEDDGPGLPEGLRLFRLFETTKEKGSGLGLAISKQIILAHAGRIDVERLEPRGTAFHVDLPLK